MAADGRSVSHDKSRENIGHPNSSTDSFKEDIQAIGRRVERLREGFAGGASSDASSKSKEQSPSGHDSLPWSRALSSSSLASEARFNRRSEPQVYAGVPQPLREWSAGRQRDANFAEEPLVERSTALRTSQSQGLLSLNELRSESGVVRPHIPTGEYQSRGDRVAVGPSRDDGRNPIPSATSQTAGGGRTIPWSINVSSLGAEGTEAQPPPGGGGGLQGEAARLWPTLTRSEETNRRRGAVLEGGDGGSDGTNSSSGSRKRHSRRREEEKTRGSSRIGTDKAESDSLLELRHALRAREDELLQLKRDVAAAASTSGGFPRLSASITGGNDLNGTSTGEPSVARLGLSVGSNRGGNGDSQPPTYSTTSSSLLNGTSHFTAAEDGGEASVFDDGDDKQPPAEMIQSTVGREIDLPGESTALLLRPKRQGSATDLPSQPLLLLPPPSQAFPLSGGHAPPNGSPLVASAYQGLRQMRMVLEEREREAGRAKEDAEKMNNRFSELSTRLRRSERKCKAQATQLAEAQTDLRTARAETAAETARLASSKKESLEAKAEARERTAAMRELDDEVVHLRERLQIATGELQRGKAAAGAVQARLEASEREAREARDRARKAEEARDAAEWAATTARKAGVLTEASAKEIAELRILVDEARGEVEQTRAESSVTAAGLRAAEEKGRRQAREAAQTREQLRAERDRLARVSLELETTIRERTQTVEKLSVSEAETGRLHVDLAAARAAAEKNKKVANEHPKAAEGLRAAEAQLGELRATLAVAREGLEKERRRVEEEALRAEKLVQQLSGSESRRKALEDDLSLARNQVVRLAAQVEGEKNIARAETEATMEEKRVAEEREVAVRATLEKVEAALQTSCEREREALENVVNLKAELVVGRGGLERAETSLAEALHRARLSEATAQSIARERESAAQKQLTQAAEVARQDKETLKRGLVAAQTQAAEVRVENRRLLAELERVSAAGTSLSAAVVTASSGERLGDVSTVAVAAAAEAAVAEAAEAAAKSAVATALEMRAELENRLALAQAEATEARTEVQRLKSKLNAAAAAAAAATTLGGPAIEGSALSGPVGVTRRAGRIEQRSVCSTPLDIDKECGAEARSPWESQALQEACTMMERVSSALAEAVDDSGVNSPGHRGESILDDPRWASTAQPSNRGRIAVKRDRTVVDRRRRRALSADSLGEAGMTGFKLGNGVDWGASQEDGLLSRGKVRVSAEHLRFSATRLLAVRREECSAADKHLARLREDLRNSEAREAETAARLEESRELSREQTGFVEGVWQERRRLEAELGARREEVERLRASEDGARTAATVLEGRVEDLSSALRKGVSRAKRDASWGAEAEVAAAGEEARVAMEAIRHQLDDLRREVDKTKRDQTRSDQPARNGQSERTDRSSQNDQSRRTRAQRSTGGAHSAVQGATGDPGEGMVGPLQDRLRNGGDETEGQAQIVADARMTSVVLEGEFQRLRAKYEKAKGRIAALEEQVAATRRAGAHARREFQGALEALKLSQELLLRIQRDRELDAGCSPDGQLPSCGNSPRTTPAIVPANAFPAAVAAAEAPGLSSSTAAAAPATNDADAHVHELTLQASRLRDMSRSVKGLLQLATGEVEGALEATGNTEIHSSSRFHGAVPPPVETDRDVRVVTTTTQTEGVLVGREVVDGLKEELRVADGATKAIQREKARLDEELHRTAVQLAEIREALSNKTAQVVELEAKVTRAESDRREARASAQLAGNRVDEVELSGNTLRAGLESKEKELLHAQRRLDSAVTTEADLRGRCEELALASSAFAAEVARQKEECAKWQKHSRLAATSASELRKRCADLIRAAKTASKERARLQKELSSARSESQEVDADVAQVLDALASSEKERRRLEGKVERQENMAEEARRAARFAEGTAVDVQRDVDRERAALVEGAGRLKGVVQVGASRLKESLDLETKRRVELERESSTLASRVTDLEAALISASMEVRKAAQLAAERGAGYERDTQALNEETSRLRSALRVETANVREAAERAAEERRKWAEEKVAMQGDTAAAFEKASRAEAEIAKQEEARQAVVNAQQQQVGESAALQKEIEEMSEVLKVETARASEANEVSMHEASRRALATQEVADLKRMVKELASALKKAQTVAKVAEDAARESAKRVHHLQAEIRSAVTINATSPPPAPEITRRRDEKSRQQGRRESHRGKGMDGETPLSSRFGMSRLEESHGQSPGFPAEEELGHHHEVNSSVSNVVNLSTGGGVSCPNMGINLSRETTLHGSSSEAVSLGRRSADYGSERRHGLASSAINRRRGGSKGGSDSSSETQERETRLPHANEDDLHSTTSVHPAGGQIRRGDNDLIAQNYSSILSGMAERASALSSPISSRDSRSISGGSSPCSSRSSGARSVRCLPSGRTGRIPRGADDHNPNTLARTSSVVVKDWKAGQQEAFSELDRRASSSSFAYHGDGIARGRPGRHHGD